MTSPKNTPLDVRRIAETIYKWISDHEVREDTCIKKIAAALVEYGEMCVANCKGESFPNVIEIGQTESYLKGRRIALEEAAKIAEDEASTGEISGCSRVLSVAYRIRARMEKPIIKGETFNHRDGQKELDKFEGSVEKDAREKKW